MSAQPQLVPVSSLKKTVGRDATQLLKDFVANEYVFAVVGPAGSGTSWVADALKQLLARAGIQSEILKASSAIEAWAKSEGRQVDSNSKLARAISLQDLGDSCRLETGDKAAVGIRLMGLIHESREQHASSRSAAGATVSERRAYILDSFKHPAETALLRQVYQDAFCQIGVVCGEDVRKQRLSSSKCKDSSEAQIEEFMRRDENADEKHGQKVTETFHLSDFFVDNTPSRMLPQGGGIEIENPEWDVADQLGRLIDVLTHAKVVRPRPNETGMFHAYGAQMRSACLSRQVGAALVDSAGNVVATGTNEVPRAGGGVYGGGFRMDMLNGKEYDHRCSVAGGYCRNTGEQKTIIQHIIDAFPELKEKDDGVTLQEKLRKTEVGRILEFSRAVHAEMDALLSAGRQGTSTVGTRMFVTTFPCHYCARHIVAAGVDEVQFIEPYLKSKALTLHGDAIVSKSAGWKPPSERAHQNGSDGEGHMPPYVLFRPFTGVAPRLYKRAFLKDRDLKNSDGKMVFGDSDASIRPELLRFSYVDVETQLIANGGHDD
ncbi:anti-phage dCTP deaminase [Paraburkholderia xenovorans]|uniref:anti-phage dCTP deaminase n=1 Tax=Paraburkholderia xenovorans TaxID=36873 RepID=UPI001C131C3A|nr:anti-phage dCTP deaminase [Paraburkholderia xenovorans]